MNRSLVRSPDGLVPASADGEVAYQWPTVAEAIQQLGLTINEEQFLAAFRLPGPALISFSGGRTSALMLWCILVAFGGRLPADFVVTFANTGKERAETLRFVYECGQRWGVEVIWLERADGKPGYVRVGLNSASRNGEPFAALIAKKQYLPNAVTRFCTAELKVRVMKHFILTEMGWAKWSNVVGLRHDEGHRILKRLHANATGKERWTSVMPLGTARITVRTVKTFWLGPKMRFPVEGPLPQGFDLGLRDFEGNCDNCFLKSYAKLLRLIGDDPASADWWIAQEATITMDSEKATPAGRRFVTEYSFADLKRFAQAQPLLIDDDLLDDDPSGDCTTEACGDETPAERRILQRLYEEGLAA